MVMSNIEDYTKEQFSRANSQLIEMSENCRAWREFLTPSNVKSFLDHKGELTCFDKYSGFGELRMLFDCEEKPLRALINLLKRDGEPDPFFTFKRRDIYDKMAYASLPLRLFIKTKSSAVVTLAIQQPMVFAASSFVLQHQKTKFNERWGRLYCNDGRLETSRHSEREVASRRNFPIDTTRHEMFAELLSKVESHGESSLFTITNCGLVGKVIKEQSELSRKENPKEILELV